jgi:hypothetical protein
VIHCIVKFISRVKISEPSSHERESCWPVRVGRWVTFRYLVIEAAEQAVSERKLDDQQPARQKAAIIVHT